MDGSMGEAGCFECASGWYGFEFDYALLGVSEMARYAPRWIMKEEVEAAG